jgi:ubiquinone/menaquinone biosynthesis C-methylase UbiE
MVRQSAGFANHFLFENLSMANRITQKLDSVFYPNASRIWDDERFVEVVKNHLQPEFHVLDFGAGRGKTTILDFRDLAERVVGVDVDEGVLENPHLHERKLIVPGEPLALADNSFDLVYSCNVLEHISTPESVFPEIQRVMKPGGLFLAKTTNKNHYIACAARFTPLWFHKHFNRLRGRETVDTFPTAYQCNSRRQIRKIALHSGLQVELLEFWEWRPEYLRISPITYLGGIAYEKLVNSTRFLAPFRAVMVVGLRKPK